MQDRRVIIFSVGLNFLLLGAIAHFGRKNTDAPGPVETLAPVTNVEFATIRSGVNSVSPPDPTLTNQFHWSKLASRDYPVYLANLRAVGCPEKTIRDIIVADVNKLFIARRRALPVPDTFWLSGTRRETVLWETDRQRRDLDEQRRALLQRLLGIDEEELPERNDLVEQALCMFILGDTTEGKADRVMQLLKKYERLKDEAVHPSGIRIAEDYARQGKLYGELRTELAQLLSADQLREFMLRASMVEHDGSGEFDELHLTEAEVRAVAEAKLGGKDPLREMFKLSKEVDEDEPLSAREQRIKEQMEKDQLHARVQAVLGEARATDYLHATDDDYRAIKGVTDNLKLPVSEAVKVYDIQRLAHAQADAIRENTDLPLSARRASLKEVRDSVEKAVAEVLGEKGFQDYRNGNGKSWLNDLSKPR